MCLREGELSELLAPQSWATVVLEVGGWDEVEEVIPARGEHH